MPKKNNENSCQKGLLVAVVVLIILLIMSLIFNSLLLRENKREAINDAMVENKLSVFDDLAREYIMKSDLTDNGVKEYYQMTGYGISDEDDVFYITFSYADYTGCGDIAKCKVEPKYGVMYFWPADNGVTEYSHAYSYHNSPYHPGGKYISVEK